MGRKIDMKKIEDVTKCQVTFSKRRTSLMRKANEIAVCCDVDVAFVAFSPSGRVSKYSGQKRIEDVLHRYVNLPADRRLNILMLTTVSNFNNLIMMNLYIYIYNFIRCLIMAYADFRIENLELQIKKSGLELQILEADLRDYEIGPEQEPSLHQLSWCERNLQNSLERNTLLGLSAPNYQQPIFQDQMEIENQGGVQFASSFDENGLTSAMRNPSSRQILMQLDPWISPYSARVRENMLQELLDEANGAPNYNPGPSNISNFPLTGSSAFYESGTALTPEVQIPPAACIPQQQSSMADESLLNIPDQNFDSWNNLFEVNSSDGDHNLVHNLFNSLPPKFTSTTVINTSDAGKSVELPQSQYYQTQTGFEYAGSDLSNFTSMQGEEIGQVLPNMDSSTNFSNGSSSNGNGNYINVDENGNGNCNEDNNKKDKSQASDVVPPPKEVGQDALFGSLPTDQNIMGDNSLWEWEYLLWDENFDVTDFNNN
ncbi:Agamous-like MADS-box protein AGL8-like protein [Abeliophyllum distichum]|uniref:Agamous-like MADS-box protein AGL8-like protein n=1 Tax=Abeliophyllum distichum TaxID=126358 RepID=A0ABD1SE62_9LAMI